MYKVVSIFDTGNGLTEKGATTDDSIENVSCIPTPLQLQIMSNSSANITATSHNILGSDHDFSTNFLNNTDHDSFHQYENHEQISDNHHRQSTSSNDFQLLTNSQIEGNPGHPYGMKNSGIRDDREDDLPDFINDVDHQVVEATEADRKRFQEVALILERLRNDQLTAKASGFPSSATDSIAFYGSDNDDSGTGGVRRSLRTQKRANKIDLDPLVEKHHEKLGDKTKAPNQRKRRKIGVPADVQAFNQINCQDTVQRKCIVCLRLQSGMEDVYDADSRVHHFVDVLTSNLNLDVKINQDLKSSNATTGLCAECKDNLQKWHLFKSAIKQRHEDSELSASKVNDIFTTKIPNVVDPQVSRTCKEFEKVKDVFSKASHPHYVHRNLTEQDLEFFCDNLFHANSVKSVKATDLKNFLMSDEKLSHLYCLKCDKLIAGKNTFEQHVELEHKEFPACYPCEICGNVFPLKDMSATTEDYYPHWISHFYFYGCGDCGKRFPNKRSFAQHRNSVHRNRQVKCDKCDKVLANKISLDLHKLVHLSEKDKRKHSIKCKLCKKVIFQWNFKTHMATHDGGRPWKCDICNSTFRAKGTLVSHRDVVHFNLKNHVCSVCGEAFKSASSLSGHVKRHQGQKDYKCDECDKEFYTFSGLKGHQITHLTTFDFVCETCGKCFKKKKALKWKVISQEHHTLHTGEKLHRCLICGRTVRVKSNLYKHMKIHNKVINPDAKPRKNAKKSSVLQSLKEVDLIPADANSINGEQVMFTLTSGISTNPDAMISNGNIVAAPDQLPLHDFQFTTNNLNSVISSQLVLQTNNEPFYKPLSPTPSSTVHPTMIHPSPPNVSSQQHFYSVSFFTALDQM